MPQLRLGHQDVRTSTPASSRVELHSSRWLAPRLLPGAQPGLSRLPSAAGEGTACTCWPGFLRYQGLCGDPVLQVAPSSAPKPGLKAHQQSFQSLSRRPSVRMVGEGALYPHHWVWWLGQTDGGWEARYGVPQSYSQDMAVSTPARTPSHPTAASPQRALMVPQVSMLTTQPKAGLLLTEASGDHAIPLLSQVHLTLSAQLSPEPESRRWWFAQASTGAQTPEPATWTQKGVGPQTSLISPMERPTEGCPMRDGPD